MDYQTGYEVLRKLFSYLKTPYKFEQFLDALSRSWDGEKMSDADFKEFVSTIGSTKKLFLSIPYKSASDFDSVLKKIASMTPVGKFPDRRMITSMFLNPKTTKPSIIDYASMVAKASGQAIKKGAEIGGTAIKFYGIVQIIAMGVGTYLLFKAFASKKAAGK